THLLKDYLFYGEADEVNEIKRGEGKTIKIDGEHMAAYRDEGGRVPDGSRNFSQLGWRGPLNPGGKSLDWPCHGSRISVDREVLEGPAYTDLPKPKEPTS